MSIFLVSTRIYAGFGIIFGIIIDLILGSNNKFIFKFKFSKDNFKSLISFVLFVLILLFFNNIWFKYINISLSFLENVNVNFIKMFKYILSLFFSPLPWNMLNDFSIYTLLVIDSMFFTVFFIAFLYFVFNWISSSKLKKKTAILIVPIIFHTLALSQQYGSGANRQKLGILPFLILFYAIGIFSFIRKREII